MYSTLISQRMGSKNLIIILMEANVCNEIRIKCFLLMSDVAKMLKYLLPKKINSKRKYHERNNI